jgi:uncharacterized membrane protein
MLIVFPVGLLIFSVISDFVYRGGGNPAWSNTAWYTMAGGIIGGLAAAIPGFIDYASITSPHTRQIAGWHMGLNLTVVVLFVISFFLRPRMLSTANAPFVLSLIGVALLFVSGWLGGSMVYVHGQAVDPTEVCEHEHDIHTAAAAPAD